MYIKIMTWNIWSGKNWMNIIKFVRDNKIDVMAFQEVDNNFRRATKNINVCKNIANALGFNYVYCPSKDRSTDKEIIQYGNCIISRFPILENKRVFLSPKISWNGKDAETEPRTSLEVKIRINGRIFCFITTHLGYSKEYWKVIKDFH